MRYNRAVTLSKRPVKAFSILTSTPLNTVHPANISSEQAINNTVPLPGCSIACAFPANIATTAKK